MYTFWEGVRSFTLIWYSFFFNLVERVQMIRIDSTYLLAHCSGWNVVWKHFLYSTLDAEHGEREKTVQNFFIALNPSNKQIFLFRIIPFFIVAHFETHAIDSKVCAYKTTSGRDEMCSENVQCEENSCTLSQSVVRYYFFVLLILMFVLWLFNMQKGATACIAVEDDVNDSVVVHTSHQSDNIIQSKALWSFWCSALDEILNKLK